MATPYKMKGSPMKRNFGIPSPAKQKTNPKISLGMGKEADANLSKKVNTTNPKGGQNAKTNMKMDLNLESKKALNQKIAKVTKKPKLPKNFNATGTSKAGKFAKVAKKVFGKAAKFAGGKTLGVLGMLSATSSKADQPTKGKGKREYEGGKIDFTKKK